MRSWLEQDTTCPICRLSLQESTTEQTPAFTIPTMTIPNFLWPSLTVARRAPNAFDLADGTVRRPAGDRRFRFDGSRYLSWLPNLSIEINNNFLFRLPRTHITNVQLTHMAQTIQQIFPQTPLEIIFADLQQTLSMDITIENIITNRIHTESQQINQQHDASESEESSSSSSLSVVTSEIEEAGDTDLL